MKVHENFVVYAHRGASEYYPENTLSSFYAGVDMGADGIETDVWRTKDGILVLWHDDDISQKTQLTGSIPDYTYAELLTQTVRNHKHARREDKITTFEEFLRYFGWRDLTFAIELKQSGIAAQVIALLEKYSMKEKTFITSFKYEELQAAWGLHSGYRLGWLYSGKTDEARIEQLRAIGAAQACPMATDLTEQELALIHENGLSCRVWGVTNTQIMKDAVDMGVDGGMTVNFPDKLLDYLKN